MAAPPATVLPFEQARTLVEQHVAGASPCGSEPVDVAHAGGRVLAEALVADRDFPPFPRSARVG